MNPLQFRQTPIQFHPPLSSTYDTNNRAAAAKDSIGQPSKASYHHRRTLPMRFIPSLVNSILFPCRPITSTSFHLLSVQRTVCNTTAPKASEYITTTQIPSNPVRCILPIRMIPSPQNYHQPPSNPIQFEHHQRTDCNNPSTKASQQLITSRMPSNGAQKTLPMRSIPSPQNCHQFP